jgi:hypothetical protein
MFNLEQNCLEIKFISMELSSNICKYLKSSVIQKKNKENVHPACKMF